MAGLTSRPNTPPTRTARPRSRKPSRLRPSPILALVADVYDMFVVHGANWRDWAAALTDDDCQIIDKMWRFWARRDQCEPDGDWRVWLMMAGRGFGKTRSGAEWVRERADCGDTTTRIAIVAATANDARAVMIEGVSGLLSVAPPGERPVWEPSRGMLVWRSGAQGTVYSAESPERLRGPEHDFAWCDELAAWTNLEGCWSNLQMGLRRGARPRVLVTTTPRALPLLRTLVVKANVRRTGGRTVDNPILPDSFLADVTATYGDTSYGRQELDGELIENIEGAMWTRECIEEARVTALPPLERVVVGVDPSASTGGDACGIVVAGIDRDGVGYVIEDATVPGLDPDGWASVVARASAVHHADCIVAEANNGGAMVASVLRAADPTLPVKTVHASHGKAARAEPVSLLYKRGLIRHVGSFPKLEDELCGLMLRGPYRGPGRSPDRADALVWAINELMLGKPAANPRISVI